MKTTPSRPFAALALVAGLFSSTVLVAADASNIDQIIQDAYNRGFQAGYAEGYRAGGGTIGSRPENFVLAPRSGGSTTGHEVSDLDFKSGQDPRLTFDLDATTRTWKGVEVSARPATTLKEIAGLLPSRDTPKGTVTIEGIEPEDLLRLEDALKKATKARISIPASAATIPANPPKSAN